MGPAATSRVSPTRVSDQEYLILAALRAHRGTCAYGVEIATELLARHGRRVPFGSLYVALQRLCAKGLLDRRVGAPPGDARRQYFRLTRAGRGALLRKESLLAGLRPTRRPIEGGRRRR